MANAEAVVLIHFNPQSRGVTAMFKARIKPLTFDAGQILAPARELQKDLHTGVDIGARVRRLWGHTQAHP